MDNFEKIIHIGLSSEGNVYCTIKFKDGKLSITGVIGPMSNGGFKGSCGQIVMGGWDIKQYAEGWSALLDQQFQEVWKRWHLNDMKAGSAVQELFLRNNPVEKYDYSEVCKKLADAGLNPDPDGYRYGSAWKKEEVPEHVIEFLKSLPDTDTKPAWI
jgi:hypothetical protein